jgi:hypothetical protein
MSMEAVIEGEDEGEQTDTDEQETEEGQYLYPDEDA